LVPLLAFVARVSLLSSKVLRKEAFSLRENLCAKVAVFPSHSFEGYLFCAKIEIKFEKNLVFLVASNHENCKKMDFEFLEFFE
jgi:hypothetical protein